MKNKPKIIAIVGPTCAGKSSLAIYLMSKINAEIISADSRQIYKEFNIGTAKPSTDELNQYKHHFINELTLNDNFSAALYVQKAKKVIKELLAQGKTPIVTGGTGLYLNMLLRGYQSPQQEPNLELRAELENIAKEYGPEKLHEMLSDMDSESAEKIHKHNLPRIIRAIEIFKNFGKPLKETRSIQESEYDTLWIGLTTQNRQILYDKINFRVDIMMQLGLEQEAKSLYEKYPNSPLLLKTIGYQEFYNYFNGKINLETVVNLIKQNTRNYAKRQLTWFRAQNDINWFYTDIYTTISLNNGIHEIINCWLNTNNRLIGH